MQNCLLYSDHALQRMAQRGISDEEIEYVCRYGQAFHCAGSVQYFLRRKDIPITDQTKANLRKLEGTTVLLDRETGSIVLTVYRNKEALGQIRRKTRYQRQKMIIQ
ncbi:MAG TPA: DUF4258 domain-containing protein [Anaerolineales bacterium]